jgi:type IV pilus assembly protein PilO
MEKNKTSASAFAPLFENIEKLTKPQRIGIYAGTLVVLVILSGWLLFWPKYGEIDRLETQLAAVEAELEKAKKNARELNEWRNKMKQKESQYKSVMRALPEKEEIPSLVAGISQAGKDAGLEFLLFQPKKEVAKGFYAEIPVEMRINGGYHQIAVFFDRVSNLPRIVNLRRIKMAPASQKESSSFLDLTCQAVTYKFVESSAEAKKGRRRKK